MQLGGGKVAKIISAKTQVVAGTNYDLQLELTSGKKYQVIVYGETCPTEPTFSIEVWVLLCRCQCLQLHRHIYIHACMKQVPFSMCWS